MHCATTTPRIILNNYFARTLQVCYAGALKVLFCLVFDHFMFTCNIEEKTKFQANKTSGYYFTLNFMEWPFFAGQSLQTINNSAAKNNFYFLLGYFSAPICFLILIKKKLFCIIKVQKIKLPTERLVATEFDNKLKREILTLYIFYNNIKPKQIVFL